MAARAEKKPQTKKRYEFRDKYDGDFSTEGIFPKKLVNNINHVLVLILSTLNQTVLGRIPARVNVSAQRQYYAE